MSDDAAKYYKLEITEAILYVRKMTSNVDVMSAIERTLLSSPSSYPYFKTIKKHFWLKLVFIDRNKRIFSHGNQSPDFQFV